MLGFGIFTAILSFIVLCCLCLTCAQYRAHPRQVGGGAKLSELLSPIAEKVPAARGALSASNASMVCASSVLCGTSSLLYRLRSIKCDRLDNTMRPAPQLRLGRARACDGVLKAGDTGERVPRRCAESQRVPTPRALALYLTTQHVPNDRQKSVVAHVHGHGLECGKQRNPLLCKRRVLEHAAFGRGPRAGAERR